MTTNKILTKIVKNKDVNGQYRIGLIIVLEDLLKDPINIEKEAKQFEADYLKLVTDLKRLLDNAKSKKNPKDYWTIGKLLNDFSSNSRFIVTNYVEAIANDLGISKSYIRFLMNFSSLLAKKYVNKRVPITHYYELIKKARKLSKANLINDVIKLLKEYVDNNNLPTSKKFRKILSDMLKAEDLNK